MPEVGDTRHTVSAWEFKHRDHFNVKGEPKRPLTQQQAEQLVIAHNAGQSDSQLRKSRLVAYECPQCGQWHTGHTGSKQK